MADTLKAYTGLSSSTPRVQVSGVLQFIIDAIPFTFDQSSRAELIRIILKDLKSTGSKSRLSNKDAAQALLAVKTLGKIPNGSEQLATPSNLSLLLSLANTFKDDPDAVNEALRCIANTMLLFDQARSTFISKEVGGGDICVSMLDKATTPDQIFTLSRILFLATASPSVFLISLVEDKRHGRTITEIIGAKLDIAMVCILSGAKQARDAMTDLLKFTFNLLLHYPKLVDCEPQASGQGEDSKVMGDCWSPKLDGLLPPLLRIYHSIPPTFPAPLVSPLTHVIHALITIPITPSLRPIWFGIVPPVTSRTSTSGSRTSSSSPKSVPHNIQPPSTNSPNTNSNNSPVTSSPTNVSPDSPATEGHRSTTPPKPSTLDRALSVLSAGRKSLSLSRSPSPHPPPSTSHDPLLRTHDLLEISFSYYFPSNTSPDSTELREKFKNQLEGTGMPSDTTLDDILSPLVVLCTRLCLADEGCRLRTREWIVPPDLDRSNALDERSDFLGRCLRMLGSVYHSRLKDSVGEMLYAMSDSDPSLLSSLVGYGHVAGFLFNKGVLSAPPPPSMAQSSSSSSSVSRSSSSTDQREINPITGTYADPAGSKTSASDELTEEEKEQEMEKLFVLFDRLERSGTLPPSQNPMRQVIQKSMGG